MDLVPIAKGFAAFLGELGIKDPYVVLVLMALFALTIIMWWTMNTIKTSNKETSKAQSETIALLKEHHKICIDQHRECKDGQDKLHTIVMNHLMKGGT